MKKIRFNLLETLYWRFLVWRRNRLLNSPFWVYSPSLKKKLDRLDAKLDKIETKRDEARRKDSKNCIEDAKSILNNYDDWIKFYMRKADEEKNK